MKRRVKEFVEVSDHTSLDMLIKTLVAVRDTLGEGAEPEIKLRGDDVFGRRLSIAYYRELSVEEAELDARYAAAHLTADSVAIERLLRTLDQVPSTGEQRTRNVA